MNPMREQDLDRQTERQTDRNDTLDLLRGIAILIVVIGHAIQANLSQGRSCFIWAQVIVTFEMPLMFLISGYAAGFSFPSRNPIQFIKKKVVRLLIPYLSWEIIHYFIVAVQPNEYRQLGVPEFLKEFFVSDFWFLRILFFLFIIMWIADVVLHLIHQEKNTTASIIVLLVLSLSVILLSRVPLLSRSVSLWYYLWFVFGYIGFHVLKNDDIQKLWKNDLWRRLTLGICLFVMVAVTLIMTRKSIHPKLVAIIFCLGICAIVCGIKPYIPAFIRQFCVDIGKNTLPIYAIHWCLLFSPLFRIQFYEKLFSNCPLFISSMLTAAVWMVICVLLIKLLRKTQLTRVLLLGDK